MTYELEVWLFTDQVGTLALREGRLSFCYTHAWLTHPHAVPLSYSLPLQPEPFNDLITRPFFAGLLPEGEMRRLLALQFHISRQNDFALLKRIGGECAGAVTLLEPGQSSPLSLENEEVRWLEDSELLTLLDELPHRPMLAGKDGLRLSLAGAQDKLPVVFKENRIGLPLHGTPSTHILKPAIRTLEHSVINEHFCLALAHAMGLNPVNAQIRQIKNQTFLLVERYDRFIDPLGHLQRLHQEDFCQALGIVPEMKYQNEGGPDFAQAFTLIRKLTRPSAPQVLRLLDYVIFNTLIGNHDAHAKNFSVLYKNSQPTLAPLYDVLSTAVYPKLTSKMAMKIGSKYKFSEVENTHWEQFAKGAGLSFTQTRKRILALAKQLPVIARKVQSASMHYSFEDNIFIEKIISLIEQRVALTIPRLTNKS